MLPLWTPRGFFDAVVGPFVVFFRTHGWLALLMLAMISLYRLPDYVMGPMAAPLYHDLGISKDVVAQRPGIGRPCGDVPRRGRWRPSRRSASATCAASSPARCSRAPASPAIALLARSGGDLRVFGAVMAADNFGISFAGVALITYMSSLTSLGYTATQYALLSSTYAYLGKILKGFSGVDRRAPRADASAVRCLCASSSPAPARSASPALLLCFVLMRVHGTRRRRSRLQ